MRIATLQVSRMRSIIAFLFFWVLLPLCVLSGAAVGSLYLLCTFKPGIVAASVQDHLCYATGMPWQIKGEIIPVLDPFPGINVSDVSLLAVSTDQVVQSEPTLPLAHVKSARLYLDIASLWRFSLRFRLIELEEPTINLAYDRLNRPIWLPLAQQSVVPPDPASSAAAPVPPDPAFSAAAGSGALTLDPPSQQEDASAGDVLATVAGLLRYEAEHVMLPIHISRGRLNSFTDKGRLLLSLSDIDTRLSPRSEKENLSLAARFSLPGAGLEVDFFLTAALGKEAFLAEGSLSGQVSMTPPGSRAVTGNFSTGFVWHEPDGEILLPDFVMTAETDTLSARLQVDLRKVLCTGKVYIHKLSLPRWFQFGRVLPPGLQQTLDGLVGDFDLYLDSRKAEARNLRGVVGPLLVRGYVGTPDFAAPVVVVDLDLDRANLDLLFPFLAAVGRYVPDPVSPHFTHLVLAPFPEEPNAMGPEEQGIDVSYDVKVRLARPRVHDVDGGPLEVLVFPVTVKGVEKTRVGFVGKDLLTGKVEGRLDIDERSVMMHYDVNGLKLGLLPENKENSVRIDGMLSGQCDITVPVGEDDRWADDWKLEADARIDGCEITGRYAGASWRLYGAKARAVGKGSIHAVRSDGVRIEGLWDLATQGVRTSWNPKGDDALSGKFDGGLHWPPVPDAPPQTFPKTSRTVERRGVERIEGKLSLNGSLIVPLGSWRPPVTGRLNSALKWLLYDETVTLTNAELTGFGSILTADMNVDYSGKDVIVRSDTECKVNARELLKGWKITVPQGTDAPKLLTGRSSIVGRSNSLRFDKLRVELDGAPVSGDVVWQGSASGTGKTDSQNGDSGLWTVRLTADHLNFDNFFPPTPVGQTPEPPSKTPWNLDFMKGISLDAQVFLRNAKRQKLTFSGTKITGTLQRDRFSLHGDIADFYNGKGTVLFQGTVVPEKSQITLRKGLMQLQGAALGKLLSDYSNESLYGGTADLVVDLSGILQNNADIPAKLSGIWSLNIANGLYPAFIGSDKSSLRNTFSGAAVSGVLDRGVLRWDNFSLKGTMVDMAGGGWYDLNSKDMDIAVSVTFAKVPTVPVRFYGNASAPRMRVRGVDMVLQTVQAAGSTVFSLVRGVLELPARAVSGISSLFGSGEKANEAAKPTITPPTAPVKPTPAPSPRPTVKQIPKQRQ